MFSRLPSWHALHGSQAWTHALGRPQTERHTTQLSDITPVPGVARLCGRPSPAYNTAHLRGARHTTSNCHGRQQTGRCLRSTAHPPRNRGQRLCVAPQLFRRPTGQLPTIPRRCRLQPLAPLATRRSLSTAQPSPAGGLNPSMMPGTAGSGGSGPVPEALRDSTVCAAFVGEERGAALAGEYHAADFCWEELRDEMEPLLQQQAQQAADQSVGGSDAATDWTYDQASWEDFHARDNATARFYKERRYLVLEFPALAAADPPPHIVELGCGAGSSILPVLRANPAARATACDISPTAVAMMLAAAERAGVGPGRLRGFAFDAAQPPREEPGPLAGLEAHGLLLIFTLAAVEPDAMPHMLAHAHSALRPGGLLMIRDHAMYDLTQLRFPPTQRISEHLYRRMDGTICSFFTKESLRELVEAAGFETLECEYACTTLFNRKKQLPMRRAFVHGIFKKR